MSPTLDDLLNDDRLARLFSKDARHCALQMWILQIKSEEFIESRVIYGRLVPYSYSSECWSCSADDNFQSCGEVQAQIVRLNLCVKSIYCAELLRRLSAGQTISAVSEEMKLGLSDQLKVRFGAAVLAASDLVYRPVAYLLNHDANDRRSPSSPHGGAGAFSASIAQTDKGALFYLNGDYDAALTAFVVRHLNADTGLDFGSTDTARFGDLELLVFPALDDFDRPLLDVNWESGRRVFIARFNPMQVPYFSGFRFRLNVVNNARIIYSGIASAERNSDGTFECRFEVGEQLGAMTDSAELEVFGSHGDRTCEGTLCCRWGIGYVREIHLQGHVVGQGAKPIRFDWLEKTTRQIEPARVKAVLTINHGNQGFASRVGGREADPWVPANRDLVSLFERLHPPKSEGHFFLRWGQSNGEGRQQFVEWFKALLAKYQQQQVVIFDPYFEDVGLRLLSLYAAREADYIVFTSMPKQKAGGIALSEDNKPALERIDNLVASCERYRRHLAQQRIKLCIHGMKNGRLHDRYILVIGRDGLPVAGFHLSNSLQSAAENYPLLVTPIPADILLEVEKYKFGLVQEAKAARSDSETKNSFMQLLFDSTASPTAPRRYEPLLFLEKVQAGDVLGVWTGEPLLRGLSGDSLKERMKALNLLKDDSLALPETAGLHNCLNQQAGDFADFTATWEVLGEVLAHSRFGDYRFQTLESEWGFLAFLGRFLETSFNRTYDEVNKELAVIDARLFREPIEALLHSPHHPDHMFHATKYTALTWPDYFAIKFLWSYAPDALLIIAESQIAKLPSDPEGSDAVRLSLLSQIASEVALSVQFDISVEQRDRLLHSSNGLLRWIGLNAIERQLEKPGGLATVLQLVATIDYSERVRILGWMVHNAARNPQKADIYQGLVVALHEALPITLTTEVLRHLVDSMRGHMRLLPWTEPWLFLDVISPLLQNQRANTDDACEIWIQEMEDLLEPDPEHDLRSFDETREGQTTNIAAFLFANSGPDRRQASLNLVQATLKRQKRIIQQPLASTSNWTRWNSALEVSMWILAFARWAEYYVRQRGITDHALEQLSRDAQELAMVRPMIEWRSRGIGNQGQLGAFLDQAEGLLISSDEPTCGQEAGER